MVVALVNHSWEFSFDGMQEYRLDQISGRGYAWSHLQNKKATCGAWRARCMRHLKATVYAFGEDKSRRD
jgi:hypothetical protein